MRRFWDRVSDSVNDIVERAGLVLMIVMVAVIGAQVVARYVFNSSFSWSEELGRYLFVWIVFLGASIGIKRSSHMGLNFIADKAAPRVKQVLDTVAVIAQVLFFLVVSFYGFRLLDKVASQSAMAMNITMAWEYAAIPTGAFISLLHLPSKLFAVWERRDNN